MSWTAGIAGIAKEEPEFTGKSEVQKLEWRRETRNAARRREPRNG